MAYALVKKTKETNVCVFEREDRLGGKIFDFNFSQVPDVAVGKLTLILHRHIFRISGTVDFFERKRPCFTTFP